MVPWPLGHHVVYGLNNGGCVNLGTNGLTGRDTGVAKKVDLGCESRQGEAEVVGKSRKKVYQTSFDDPVSQEKLVS